MKKKVIRLKERDILRIVKRVLTEQPMDMDSDGDQIPDRLDMDSDGDGNIDYYGTWDDVYKVNRNDEEGDFEDYDGPVDKFKTWDEYQGSRYANDGSNRWAFNSKRKERGSVVGANDPEEGRYWFDRYQKNAGGKPFKVKNKY